MAARCWIRWVRHRIECVKRRVYLDWTLFQDHAAGNHDLRVRPSNVKVPSSAVVGQKIGDMTTVERHSHHGKLLDSFSVGGSRSIGEGAVYMVKVGGRVRVFRGNPGFSGLQIER